MPRRETLKELIVRLSMDSKDIRKELKIVSEQTSKTALKMEKSFQRAGKSAGALRKVIGGLSIAFAARAIGGFLRDTARAGNEIERLSGRLRITTDQVQELQIVAARTGVDFNALATIVQRVNRRLGDVARGNQILGGAFEEAGVAIRDENGALREGLDVTLDLIQAQRTLGVVGSSIIGQITDIEGLKELGQLINFDVPAVIAAAHRDGLLISPAEVERLRQAEDSLREMEIIIKDRLTDAAVGFFGIFEQFRDVSSFLTPGTAQSAIDTLLSRLAELNRLQAAQGFLALEQHNAREIILERINALSERGVALSEREAVAARETTVNVARQAEILAKRKRDAEQLRFDARGEADLKRAQAIEDQITRIVAGATNDRIALINAEFEVRLRNIRGLQITSKRANELIVQATLAQTLQTAKALEAIAKESEKATDKMLEGVTAVQERFTDAFADMLVEGEFTFQQLAKSFLKDFLSTILNEVSGPLVSGVSSVATTVVSSLFGASTPAPGLVSAGALAKEIVTPKLANTGALAATGGGAIQINVYEGQEQASVNARPGSAPGSLEIDVLIGTALANQATKNTRGAQTFASQYGLRRNTVRRG